ncbi:MAG: exo-alpha-sialidase [Gemmataceae bacterium]|nr:exo-alpha-sialidase [Gemmataceae bacterium]
MRILNSALAALSLATLAVAGEVEKTNLFQAKKAGYALYRIPCVTVTSKGTVLVACEARKSEKGDWGHIDLLLRRSADGGKNFSPPVKLPMPQGKFERNPAAIKQGLGKDGDVTLNNPVLISGGDGKVHFLFCVEYMRCFYSQSNDDGVTFSTPVEITQALEPIREKYHWIVCATGPGHGIQTKKGRLIVPVWLSRGTGGHAHRPSSITTLYSDDQGKTWAAGDLIAGEADPLGQEKEPFINPNETTAVELADGRVMLNIRSESKVHQRAAAYSANGATGWTEPAFVPSLTEPICFGSLERLPVKKGGRELLLFSHPDNLAKAKGEGKPGQGRDRKNLSLHASDDVGVNWKLALIIEKGASAYSDLAVLPDGAILCFYENGGSKDYAYEFLTLARIPPLALILLK